jgi:cobalamin biosynthesis protein CobD/CbiB
MFRSEIRRMASALAHDVGKYVARTARNMPDGTWTPERVSMLLRDLYDLRGERALQAFLRLAPPVTSPLASFPEWTTAHDLLCELDGMENELRAGHTPALNGAARRALLVESALRELTLSARSSAPVRKPKGRIP